MPFINIKTTKQITQQCENDMKAALGKSICNLGKSEAWLMLNFEQNCHLYFKGKNDRDIAFAEVALFGKASNTQYDNMTRDVTDILCNSLGISPDCVYVKYEETDHWGYNGFNF